MLTETRKSDKKLVENEGKCNSMKASENSFESKSQVPSIINWRNLICNEDEREWEE
jgi:hypothetical protein